MNVSECAKLTKKSYTSIRKQCVKVCPGRFEVAGLGYFDVEDVRKPGTKKAEYEITKCSSSKDKQKNSSPGSSQRGLNLKDQHLKIKIKKEQQQLYDRRLLFVEKIKDIFLQEYHLPRIAGLTEVVRKHGSKELYELWNQEIKDGSTENLENLQQALQEAILN